MAHHLLPEMDRSWISTVTNCFLIRAPGEVITSYVRKNDDPELDDLGFKQQTELFEFVRANSGAIPPVIDAGQVLDDPAGILRLLCNAVGVEFDQAMLSWPRGLRETDGVWAKYWYKELAQTTCFRPYRATTEEVATRLKHIADKCDEYYQMLYQHRLR
jgi:hypothetical protein